MDKFAAWSRVCGNIHPDIYGDSRANCEPKIQRSRDTDRECGMCRAGSDGRDSVDGSHIGSTPKPIPHHCVCCTAPLPLAPGSRLHRSTGFRVHLCFLRSQGCFPSLLVRWSYGPFRKHQYWPGFRTRVYHHF